MLGHQEENVSSLKKFEQRRHPRFPLYTSATLLKNNQDHDLCWIKNLSVDGALVAGHERFKIGSRLNLLLYLPWYKPVKIDAQVVRRHPSSPNVHYFGLKFRHIPRSTQIKIDRVIKAAEKCATQERDPAILIISDETEICYALERNLSLLGVDWVIVNTPLDAIRWLQDWKIKIDTVLVDLSIEHFNVLTMLRFLSEEHPQVKRILIGSDQRKAFMHDAASYGRVNAVLDNPDDQQQLAEAIGAPL